MVDVVLSILSAILYSHVVTMLEVSKVHRVSRANPKPLCQRVHLDFNPLAQRDIIGGVHSFTEAAVTHDSTPAASAFFFLLLTAVFHWGQCCWMGFFSSCFTDFHQK